LSVTNLLTLAVHLPPVVALVMVARAVAVVIASPLAKSVKSMDTMHFIATIASTMRLSLRRIATMLATP
jgi:hypothetical protein